MRSRAAAIASCVISSMVAGIMSRNRWKCGGVDGRGGVSMHRTAQRSQLHGGLHAGLVLLGSVLGLLGCGDDGDSGDDGSTTATGATTSATVAPESSTDASAGTSSSTGLATSEGTTTAGDTIDPDTGTGTGTDDSGSDTAGTTGDPLGDCCMPHGTPGCSVLEIQECVCMIDAPCCVGAWDGVCVGEVEKQGCADCTP